MSQGFCQGAAESRLNAARLWEAVLGSARNNDGIQTLKEGASWRYLSSVNTHK